MSAQTNDPSSLKSPGNPSRNPKPALALFSSLLLPLVLISGSFAQTTSSSSSAHSSAPPTGSVAPPTRSVAPPTSPSSTRSGPRAASSPSTNSHPGRTHRHHAGDGDLYYPYYPYLYSAPAPNSAGSSDDSDDDGSNYQGGPTIFDRRGSGPDSYIPPANSGPAHPRPNQLAAGSQPEGAPSSDSAAASDTQTPTTLVFKDGRQLEVANYAIVGQTLYDLTPGHARKIALADLDLAATEKQNDGSGASFELPPSSQAH